MHSRAQDEAYEKRIAAIQSNITKLQSRLKEAESKSKTANPDSQSLMRQLNSEYQQLRQARLDRKGEYKNQYDQLSAIRKERQKDIQTRQQEFEKEMMQKEEAKQKKQHDSDLIACDTLERLLQQVLDQQEQDVEELGIDDNPAQERIQLVNSPIEQEEDDGVDTSVLMIPLGIMELFWEIHVQVPVRFTEIEPTLNRIRERRAELSR